MGSGPGPPLLPEVATRVVPIEDGLASRVVLEVQRGVQAARAEVRARWEGVRDR